MELGHRHVQEHGVSRSVDRGRARGRGVCQQAGTYRVVDERIRINTTQHKTQRTKILARMRKTGTNATGITHADACIYRIRLHETFRLILIPTGLNYTLTLALGH